MSLHEESAQLGDLVDRLEQEAMALENGGGRSQIHLLFRTVHNLKSLSAYMGFKGLATAFHRLEDGLDGIRRGKEEWSPSWADQVFRSIDEARRALGSNALRAEEVPPSAPSPEAVSPWGMPLGPGEDARIEDALLLGMGIYRLEKLFTSGLSREDFRGLPVMEDIAEQGVSIAVYPAWEAYEAGPPEQMVQFLFGSARSFEELSRVFFDPLIQLRPPQAPPVLPAETGPIRCLVIEDDPGTGAVMKQVLKKFGCCMVAATARAGFAQFREAWERSRPYDVLLLDLGLPDLSGLTVLRTVRRFESDHRVPWNARCKVVVCTASEDREDIQNAILLEADGYLVKPIAPDALEEKIRFLLER